MKRSVLAAWACACALAAGGAARAETPAEHAPQPPDETAAAWLQKAASAAKTLHYTGMVVYQRGSRVEVSRLFHYSDASGDYEKVVSLEGPLTEIIRHNDQVSCFFPDAKAVKIEPRSTRSFYPALQPSQIATLQQNYTFRKAELTRIAGLEAQAWLFEPKDNLRYAHKFWADVASGLLLKARMMNEKNELLEQFMFYDIQVGAKLDRDSVRASYTAAGPGWQVSSADAGIGSVQNTGWQVKSVPPGFNKVSEGYRQLPGRQEPVAHLIFSDGLVSVSVFIEHLTGTPQKLGMQQEGGMNMFFRQWEDYLITVLGQVPAPAVRRIAFSVARR
jgi:sigma-E factor negative regulatory protein RseB